MRRHIELKQRRFREFHHHESWRLLWSDNGHAPPSRQRASELEEFFTRKLCEYTVHNYQAHQAEPNRKETNHGYL